MVGLHTNCIYTSNQSKEESTHTNTYASTHTHTCIHKHTHTTTHTHIYTHTHTHTYTHTHSCGYYFLWSSDVFSEMPTEVNRAPDSKQVYRGDIPLTESRRMFCKVRLSSRKSLGLGQALGRLKVTLQLCNGGAPFLGILRISAGLSDCLRSIFDWVNEVWFGGHENSLRTLT